MHKLLIPILFLLVISISSCGPKIYEAPNAAAITASHSVVAIIPPTVTIQGRPNEYPEDLKIAVNLKYSINR